MTVDQRRPHTGSSIVATVVVANVGGSPVYSVTVGLYWSDLALMPDRLASAPLGKLLPGHRFSRRFRVKVLGPGVARIAFAASSANTAKSEATVLPPGRLWRGPSNE